MFDQGHRLGAGNRSDAKRPGMPPNRSNRGGSKADENGDAADDEKDERGDNCLPQYPSSNAGWPQDDDHTDDPSQQRPGPNTRTYHRPHPPRGLH